MKVSVLVENSVCRNCLNSETLEGEHGLSVHIELNNTKILFDTGQTDMFSRNAEKMGIDLSEVDYLIISHGHYDHGGGLKEFFRLNKKAEVYMHRKALGEYYSASKGNPRYIGIDKEVINENIDRISLIDDDAVITEGVQVLSGFPKDFPLPKGNKLLFEKQNGELVNDKFEHEILLVISENDKNIVFTACSHSGVINMVNRAEEYLSHSKIEAVLGGFHLSSKGKNAESPKYLDDLVRAIEKFDVPFYTGHCTGEENFINLKNKLGENLKSMNSGEVIDFF
ncbi:MAG: MBL fold metallo-hydrolase [Bacteroidota bacterium]